MRLIDADALEEQLCDKAKEMLGIAEQCKGTAINYYTGAKYGFSKSALIANDLPTIDPVKNGKWVKKMEVIKNEKFDAFIPKWYCPSCGKEYDPAVVKAVGIKFCYECGERVEE